jgi:aspartyl-tRNA(Asn)/glutamyl-tRNA(Gln) amidotransferase subunit A
MDVGTLTRTAEDAALLHGVLAEKDSREPAEQLAAIRIGVPQREIEAAGVSPEIQTAFDQALREFEALGLKAHAVAPRWMTEARAANFIILNAEEYSLHKRNLRERLDAYGKSASLYLLQGAFLSSADYLIALEARSAVTEEIDRMFEQVDILAMPVSPFTTPDEARAPAVHRRGVGAAFTAPFNLSGHPALSIPCGISSSGLPMGIQLVGRKGEEAVLLKVASSFQRHTAWTEHHPKLPAVLGKKPVPSEMH